MRKNFGRILAWTLNDIEMQPDDTTSSAWQIAFICSHREEIKIQLSYDDEALHGLVIIGFAVQRRVDNLVLNRRWFPALSSRYYSILSTLSRRTILRKMSYRMVG